MKSDLHVIKVRAPVYQAAVKLEDDYPGQCPIAVSEWLMDRYAYLGDKANARFWRAVWGYCMERDCMADTETLADITP